MRWHALFADLEGQMAAAERTELDAEVRDRTRREAALIRTVDRLRGAVGQPVTVLLEGPTTVHGRLVDAGSDWLLLEEQADHEALVSAAAVLGVRGLGRYVSAPGSEGEVERRLDLRWALRGLVRSRAAVQLLLRDGSTVPGTLDRVGADHLDLAEHVQGEPRRASAVAGVRLVPLSALVLVRQA